ncbi:hypothetical protein G6F24_017117 [Rhizopus arrhizus]|nr:hypothetical protein G6F24_017117 [Rhizopus arrhizus]
MGRVGTTVRHGPGPRPDRAPARLQHRRRSRAGRPRPGHGPASADRPAPGQRRAGRGAAAQRGREQGRDRRPWLHQLPPGPGRVPARSRVGDQGRP